MAESSLADGQMAEKKKREDIWMQDKCLVCQSRHFSEAAKEKHVTTEMHQKKTIIYDFFLLEASSFKSSPTPSLILDHCKQLNLPLIGLECIHELLFPWSFAEHWWACSICFSSGRTLAQLDEHLLSAAHKATYIEEFHPARKPKANNPKEIALELEKMGVAIIAEEQAGQLLSPEVLTLSASREWAASKLAVEVEAPAPFHLLAISPGLDLLRCNTCRESIPCVHGESDRVWTRHVAQSTHSQRAQRAAIVSSLVDRSLVDADAMLTSGGDEEQTDFNWQCDSHGAWLGPAVAADRVLLLVASDNSRAFCLLCSCILHSIDEASRHLRCESHIAQYLADNDPIEMHTIVQLEDSERRRMMKELLTAKRRSRVQARMVAISELPVEIEHAEEAICNLPSMMPPVVDLNGLSCLWCEICCRVVVFVKEPASSAVDWNAHVRDAPHLEMTARRRRFHFHESNFVDITAPTYLTPASGERGTQRWSRKKVPDSEECIVVQNVRDVGLEWVVDDRDEGQFVCLLCALAFAKSTQTSAARLHVRSESHLLQYLHSTNIAMVQLLNDATSSTSKRDLMLDFLTHCAFTSPERSMRVYDSRIAEIVNAWGHIELRRIHIALMDGDMRDVFAVLGEVVDRVAMDREENGSVTMKEALVITGIKLHCIDENGVIALFCTHCQQSFFLRNEQIRQGDWLQHFAETGHARRKRALLESGIDPAEFSRESCAMRVVPVDALHNGKKVAWRRRDDGRFEFVLRVIGLDAIVERRRGNGTEAITDFFCRLCAHSFRYDQARLEEHVRSMEHLVNYAHAMHPMLVWELQSRHDVDPGDDGGRWMRERLTQALRGESYEGRIRVYDPDGVGRKERSVQEAPGGKSEEKKHVEEEKVGKRKEMVPTRRTMKKEAGKTSVDRKKREDARQRERVTREAKTREAERERRRRDAQRREERERRARRDREGEREKHRVREKNHTVVIDAKRTERVAHSTKSLQLHAMEQRLHQEQTLLAEMRRERERVEREQREREQLMHVQLQADIESEQNAIRTRYWEMWNDRDEERYAFGGNREQHEMNGDREQYWSTTSCDMNDGESSSSYRALANRDHHEMHGHLHDRLRLIDYLIEGGTEELREREWPHRINAVIARETAAIGAHCLHLDRLVAVARCDLPSFVEVSCTDASVETLLCAMCGVWDEVDAMIEHLSSERHHLQYLFHNFKMYHNAVIEQGNDMTRSAMLRRFVDEIRAIEGTGQVRGRMRIPVDVSTLQRVWPGLQVERYRTMADCRREERIGSKRFDNPPTFASSREFSPPEEFIAPIWPGILDDEESPREQATSPKPVPPPVMHPSSGGSMTRKRVESGGRMVDAGRNGKAMRKQGQGKETTRRRSPLERRATDRKRSRSRSPSPAPRRVSPLATTRRHEALSTTATGVMSWEQQAAAFLNNIGDRRAASKVLAAMPASSGVIASSSYPAQFDVPPPGVSVAGFADRPTVGAMPMQPELARYGEQQQQQYAAWNVERARQKQQEVSMSQQHETRGPSMNLIQATNSMATSGQSTQNERGENATAHGVDQRSAPVSTTSTSAEALLIKLLLEEREKKRKQEEEQKQLMRLLAENIEKDARAGNATASGGTNQWGMRVPTTAATVTRQETTTSASSSIAGIASWDSLQQMMNKIKPTMENWKATQGGGQTQWRQGAGWPLTGGVTRLSAAAEPRPPMANGMAFDLRNSGGGYGTGASMTRRS